MWKEASDLTRAHTTAGQDRRARWATIGAMEVGSALRPWSQRPRDLRRSAGWALASPWAALVAAGLLWGRGAGDGMGARTRGAHLRRRPAGTAAACGANERETDVQARGAAGGEGEAQGMQSECEEHSAREHRTRRGGRGSGGGRAWRCAGGASCGRVVWRGAGGTSAWVPRDGCAGALGEEGQRQFGGREGGISVSTETRHCCGRRRHTPRAGAHGWQSAGVHMCTDGGVAGGEARTGTQGRMEEARA